jgi:hypothetical protein
MSPDAAVAVFGGIVVAVVGGAAWFSVRSAVRGPRWALARAPIARAAGVVLLVLGIGLWMFGGQPWLGLATVYLAAMVLLMGFLLRRSLSRVEALGALDDVSAGVRADVLRRAKLGLAAGGAAFLVGGVSIDGTLSLIMFGIAAVLGLNWLGLQLARSPAEISA